MAVLAGTILNSCLASAGGRITSDIAVYSMLYQPSAHEPPSTPAGGVNRTVAQAFTRQIDGVKLRSYVDDFYYRIHVIPARLDLGNVASAQVVPAVVWNAYFSSKNLTSIEAVAANGISITGPTAPATVTAMQVLSYQVGLTLDGPPVADARIIWHFSGEPDSVLPVTATRVIPFAFLPDWAGGVLERLSWLTNVLRSPSGSEQRRALRLSPRRAFEAPVIVESSERQYFDMSLWGWSGRTWAMPVWHDIQLLDTGLQIGAATIPCATANREFRAGGLALLRGATAWDVEVVEIDAVGVDSLTLHRPTLRAWSRGSRLYPARLAQLAQMPELSRVHDRASVAPVLFRLMECSDWPAAGPATTYRGFPVLEQRPEESEDLTATMQRLLKDLDNATGIPVRTDLAGHAFTSQSHRWALASRAEHAAFRSLLHFLEGRWKALWVPTFADDLTLTATTGSSDTALTIANIGYNRFAGTAPGRRDIRVELRDGTVFHRRITGSTETSASAETLAIDTAFGRDVTPADIGRISWLALCRLDQDDIELQHETDAAGSSKCQVIFRSIRDEF